MRSATALAAAVGLAGGLLAAAHAVPAAADVVVDGPFGSRVSLELQDRLRVELVDWFEPPPGPDAPPHRYEFLANKLQVGLRVEREPMELFLELQNVVLTGVPRRGLGPGGGYWANTSRETQVGTSLRQGWLLVEGPEPLAERLGLQALSFAGGRQLYSDGLDAPARDPALLWLQANRVSQRLLGPFDFTHAGRSFDGGKLRLDTADWNLTGIGFVPTRGGFEIRNNGELDIVVAGASLNLKDSPAVTDAIGPTVARLFYLYYQDDRDVVFLDNRPLAERLADRGRAARIHSFGGNVVHRRVLGTWAGDVMAYGFGQLGDWQSQRQAAWAWGVEAGVQLEEVLGKPWLRVGINLGSGDTDPTDGVHGTFFQLLPTAWLYARFPFYNMMNSQDVFAQVLWRPHPKVFVTWDLLHWLRRTSSLDFAYFGGGATKDDFFGYGSTGDTRGGNELAYVTQVLLSVRPVEPLTLNVLYAHAWGQGTIGASFDGRSGDYGFIEAVLSF